MKKYYITMFSAMILLFALGIPLVAQAETEAYYQEKICAKYDARMEVINEDRTRTDCLSDENGSHLSIEVDFAKKWYECLTQAMYYGMLYNNQAACVLIVEKDTDMRHVDRARQLINHNKLPVWVDAFRE